MPMFPVQDPRKLNPSMVDPAAVTVRPGINLDNLSPRARAMFDKINELDMPQAVVTSGHRDPFTNRRVGGAGGSQHLDGNAIDIDISKLTPEQRQQLSTQAVSGGARGIGIYPSGNSMHVDTRDNPAAWGTVPGAPYAGAPVETFPAWAQPAIAQAAGSPAPALPPARVVQPAPSILAQAQAAAVPQNVQPQGNMQGPPASASTVAPAPANNGLLAALGMNNEATDKIGGFLNSTQGGQAMQGVGILAKALSGGEQKSTPAPQIVPIQDTDHKPDASLMAMLDPRRRRSMMGA